MSMLGTDAQIQTNGTVIRIIVFCDTYYCVLKYVRVNVDLEFEQKKSTGYQKSPINVSHKDVIAQNLYVHRPSRKCVQRSVPFAFPRCRSLYRHHSRRHRSGAVRA